MKTEEFRRILKIPRSQVYPFEKYINFNADKLKRDYDRTIVIDGVKGSGKSAFCYWSCKRLTEVNCGAGSFDLKKHICASPIYTRILSMFKGTPQYSGLVLDEIVKGAYSKDWMTREGKDLVKFYQTNRKEENKASFFALPEMKLLNSDLRGGCDEWIHILSRGVGALYLPDPSGQIGDPWFFDDREKFVRDARKRLGAEYYNIEAQLDIAGQMPGFKGFLLFPDFPEKVKGEYLELCKSFEDELAGVPSEDPLIVSLRSQRDTLLSFVTRKFPGWGIQRLKDETGLTRAIIAEWVRVNNIEVGKKDKVGLELSAADLLKKVGGI